MDNFILRPLATVRVVRIKPKPSYLQTLLYRIKSVLNMEKEEFESSLVAEFARI